MKRRRTARFVVALVACLVAGDRLLPDAVEVGERVAGGWGVAAALLLLGFAVALLVTVVYDGPRALRASRAGGT